MKNIEPIFVIIDDFSAYGYNHNVEYKTGSINASSGPSLDVCLYDYGFVDFKSPSGELTIDNQADFVSVSNPEHDVLEEYLETMGIEDPDNHISAAPGGYQNFFPNYELGTAGTFNIGGSIHGGNAQAEWQFIPSKYDDYEYGLQDDVPATGPSHGDFVFQQFAEQLNSNVAEAAHVFLIDVDFGEDLSALMSSSSGSAIDSIYESFLETHDDGMNNTLYPLFGMTASFGGPKGPGAAGDEIQFFAEQPGAVLQASANANQGGHNWASDSDYEYVMTVGAWNMGQDGNIAATEHYLKSEIDVYADGYVNDLFGYSGFGTSYATPAVAAETMNLLYSAVEGKFFDTEADISDFLFDVITPGFQSPEMWAAEVGDLITTDVQVNFTNGSSQVVKVMTSDLDENGTLSPSQLTGYNGEKNYWGSNLVIESYERLETDLDEIDFSAVGPQLESMIMEYSGPDPDNGNNYKVSLEIIVDTPIQSHNFSDVSFTSYDENGGSTVHNMSLEPAYGGVIPSDPSTLPTIFTWSLLTGQDPSQWTNVNNIVFNAFQQSSHEFETVDFLGNTHQILIDLSSVDFISGDVEFTELGSGSDKYYGSDDADYVITGGGADYLLLGGGDDLVAVSGSILTTQDNPFDGKTNAAIINTGSGNDVVEILTDASGSINLVSGGGNDRLVIEGLPGDFSMGASGNDLVISGNNVSINLANQMLVGESGTNTFSYLEYVASDGTSEVFVLDVNAPAVSGGIVTVVGTDKDDYLKLHWHSNPGDMKGLAGDDRLKGGFSDDYIDGGSGDDYLEGKSGEDTLTGGTGEDWLEGGKGSDYLAGGAGDDVYIIEVDYGSFFDIAGYDNYDETLPDGDPSNEDQWDLIVGNVDTIIDSAGTDKLVILTPPSSENPFDQYHDHFVIDSSGSLNLNWLYEPASETSYQYALKEGYEYTAINQTAFNGMVNGAYIPVQANGKSGRYDQVELVFLYQEDAEQKLNEWFAGHPAIDAGPLSKYIYKLTPQQTIKGLQAGTGADGLVGKDSKGLDINSKANMDAYGLNAEALAADGIVFPTKFSSLVDLQSSFPSAVSMNDVVVLQGEWNYYDAGVNLSNLQGAGFHLDFDLYKVETWPNFDSLPKATNVLEPEVGTQEYWLANFDLYGPEINVPDNLWPANNEFPLFVDLAQVKTALHDGTLQGNQGYSWGPISNVDAELVQGANIHNFAIKDEHGNWSNTIESVILLDPTKALTLGDEIIANVKTGVKSGFDSIEASKSTDFIEYFLSPSGVVDQGLHKEPTFNPDGSVKSYKETTKWKGADTQKSFLLVANEELTGQNSSSLGFGSSTANHTDDDDRVTNPNSLSVASESVLTSGAAMHDILIGSDSIADVMFGHGGNDWIQGNGGENLLVGGSGDDKFVIENGAQNTVIIGDHAKMEDGDFDTEPGDYDPSNPSADITPKYKTINENYSDLVFFDFTWPFVDPVTSAKDTNSYIEQKGINHFKVFHTLDNGETMTVELYDVEGAYFSDGSGGLEYHALTTGRPITSADFIDKTPLKGRPVNYEKNEIKFHVEHNDADYSGATSISVVTTVKKTITLPDKSRLEYEEPTVHWKGLATEASAFKFADVTVNVVNVTDTDLTGAAITDPIVMGTSAIDLIIGDENDNIIYGGESDDIIFGGDGEDIIFGEGGDDVLIGGDMDDILYGDYEFESDIPDLTLDDKGNVLELPAHLAEGNDVIVGGAGRDEIISGDGNNVVASGDLSAVILNTELDDDHTFINYDEDDQVPT